MGHYSAVAIFRADCDPKGWGTAAALHTHACAVEGKQPIG